MKTLQLFYKCWLKVTKQKHRRNPLQAEKSEESLKVLFDECTSSGIISTKTVCKLSMMASVYICAHSSPYDSKASETRCQNSL
jgi:hypothetical protein